MTCGVCDPEAFREPIGTDPVKGRVLGYTCRQRPGGAVRDLFYYGAQCVFWDAPSRVPVLRRPELSLALSAARPGDVLVILRDEDLGTRRETQKRVLAHLHDLGIAVMVLKSDRPETATQETTRHDPEGDPS